MFHTKHGPPTQTNPVCSPLLVFSPCLVRKHIYKCNLFFIFLWLKPHLMGFQNDTTKEQSLTSMFGKKTQERQHLPWGTEQKQGAVFPNKWKNKNIQSNHYKVKAPLRISFGYLRWIKAKPEAHATTGKESRCLGHFPGYFMMKNLKCQQFLLYAPQRLYVVPHKIDTDSKDPAAFCCAIAILRNGKSPFGMGDEGFLWGWVKVETKPSPPPHFLSQEIQGL